MAIILLWVLGVFIYLFIISGDFYSLDVFVFSNILLQMNLHCSSILGSLFRRGMWLVSIALLLKCTILQVGADGDQEAAVVELQCSQDPGDCPFVISAHFLLADHLQVMPLS